ncbi:MAG: hypothetical protein IPL25_03500 [Saprospiraceae bacterium]|nr:hypothetical protein [Candidatus Vicinibacter affinis]
MKGNLLKIFILIPLLACIKLMGQGCVAIRSTGSNCGLQSNSTQPNDGWQFNASYRNFKSFRHFRGKEEEEERVANGSDVRNYTNNFDLSLTKFLGDRWSLSIFLPFQSTSRSSLYEHDGKTRHFTSATGMGDLRFTVGAWLFKPTSKGNLQVGLGLKLPTGDYNYQDYFYKNDTTYSFGPVDQSIQLGDGGTGVSFELNGFFNIVRSLGVYGNFYYLVNPREQNGVSTTRGGTASATAIKYKTNTMSVADQYLIRGGVNYNLKNFAITAGVRMECVPSEDLIGGSNGFRRPGYVIAAEPTISYQIKSLNIFAAVPFALERNRVQSYSDKLRSADTGTKVVGDAAFADYSVSVGISYRFGNKMHVSM